MIKFGGFDDCILGSSISFDGEMVLVYSEQKIIQKLQDSSDMDFETAHEYYLFNIAGMSVGPVIVDEDFDLDEYDDQEE